MHRAVLPNSDKTKQCARSYGIPPSFVEKKRRELVGTNPRVVSKSVSGMTADREAAQRRIVMAAVRSDLNQDTNTEHRVASCRTRDKTDGLGTIVLGRKAMTTMTEGTGVDVGKANKILQGHAGVKMTTTTMTKNSGCGEQGVDRRMRATTEEKRSNAGETGETSVRARSIDLMMTKVILAVGSQPGGLRAADPRVCRRSGMRFRRDGNGARVEARQARGIATMLTPERSAGIHRPHSRYL